MGREKLEPLSLKLLKHAVLQSSLGTAAASGFVLRAVAWTTGWLVSCGSARGLSWPAHVMPPVSTFPNAAITNWTTAIAPFRYGCMGTF